MKQQRRVATILGAVLGTAFALLVAAAEGRAEVVDEFHHVYALSATGSVTLKNVNGDVHISAWDRNEETHLRTGSSQESGVHTEDFHRRLLTSGS